jgi:hypothetical protein
MARCFGSFTPHAEQGQAPVRPRDPAAGRDLGRDRGVMPFVALMIFAVIVLCIGVAATLADAVMGR